jgi:hypothetical protein
MDKPTIVEKREGKILWRGVIPWIQIRPVKFPLRRKSIYPICIFKYFLIICILLC